MRYIISHLKTSCWKSQRRPVPGISPGRSLADAAQWSSSIGPRAPGRAVKAAACCSQVGETDRSLNIRLIIQACWRSSYNMWPEAQYRRTRSPLSSASTLALNCFCTEQWNLGWNTSWDDLNVATLDTSPCSNSSHVAAARCGPFVLESCAWYRKSWARACAFLTRFFLVHTICDVRCMCMQEGKACKGYATVLIQCIPWDYHGILPAFHPSKADWDIVVGKVVAVLMVLSSSWSPSPSLSASAATTTTIITTTIIIMFPCIFFFAMHLRVFNHFHLFDPHVLPFGYPRLRCAVPVNRQIEIETVQSGDWTLHQSKCLTCST